MNFSSFFVRSIEANDTFLSLSLSHSDSILFLYIHRFPTRKIRRLNFIWWDMRGITCRNIRTVNEIIVQIVWGETKWQSSELFTHCWQGANVTRYTSYLPHSLLYVVKTGIREIGWRIKIVLRYTCSIEESLSRREISIRSEESVLLLLLPFFYEYCSKQRENNLKNCRNSDFWNVKKYDIRFTEIFKPDETWSPSFVIFVCNLNSMVCDAEKPGKTSNFRTLIKIQNFSSRTCN